MAKPIGHRLNLTITIGSTFGAILAVVFWIVTRQFAIVDTNATDLQLQTVAGAVAKAIPNGAVEHSLEEVSESPNGITVSVFDSNKTLRHHVGPLKLNSLDGSGNTGMNGVLVRYKSVKVQNLQVVVASNWTERSRAQNEVSLLLVVIWFPITGIACWIIWLSASHTFRPLLAMTQEAQNLTRTGADSRLAVPHDIEFGMLANELNRFLDKIQQGVTNQEKFLADAAHELRTPLTILRGQVETTLLRDRSSEEYKVTLNLILEESVRMSRLVQLLLISSRAATTLAPMSDLTLPVQDAVDRWKPQFEAAGVHLTSTIRPCNATILSVELEMVLDNLLVNALRHAPKGSTCTVVLESEDGTTRLRVSDEGAGVPEELREVIFERFYRKETDRNRETGGFGIGLSICKRIAKERGAEISVFQNEPNGAVFELKWTS